MTGIRFDLSKPRFVRRSLKLLAGRSPSRWRGVVGAVAAVTALVVVAVPASAVNGPECKPVFGGVNPADPVERTLTLVVLAGYVHGLREPTCEAKWKIEWFEPDPAGSEEYPAGSGHKGKWKEVPGGSGTVTGAEGERAHFETGDLPGLEPETAYPERGILTPGEPGHGTFEAKLLRPFGAGMVVEPADVSETAAHVKGGFAPAPFEAKWRVEYSSRRAAVEEGKGVVVGEGIVSQAEAEALQTAEGARGYGVEVDITGLEASKAYFVRLVAEDEPEWPLESGVLHHGESVSNIAEFETRGPPAAEAFATPALRLETLRALGSVTPHGFDTHYYFEYGPTTAYGSKTPTEDAGSEEARTVGANLPGLQQGGTYHYRIVASNAAGSGAVVHGKDQVLTVPLAAAGSVAVACPNEALRTGASAALSVCRAYEQITPVDKEGAEEPISYAQQVDGGVMIGEDGDRAMLHQPVTKWGSDGLSPYFFARGDSAWSMTTGTLEPEAGVDAYEPQLVSPDLKLFAFAAQWKTSAMALSPTVEFRTGPPGGPYTTLATVRRAQVGPTEESGWVAASGDFSKLILRVEDHNVCGSPTGTQSGYDLYEFADGRCAQVNAKAGTCGARMARDFAEGGARAQLTSARDAVSQDGGRVFFEAAPGGECSASPHLYERVNGQTVDIGTYHFVAANPPGSQALLEARSGKGPELLFYDTSTETSRRLLALHEELPAGEHTKLVVSEDFSTVYLWSRERLTGDAPPVPNPHDTNLYRYDIAAGTLTFITQIQAPPDELEVSADGRYAYWIGYVTGLPFKDVYGEDAIAYDSVQNVVQCVSCASAQNPEPGLSVARSGYFGSGVLHSRNGTPRESMMSADGSRIFFDTPASLLLADIDGEIAPFGGQAGAWWSASSDVYEWRRNGVGGCGRIQGCLSLVSGGQGGRLVELLGADPSGRNVMFTTGERLVAQDTDNALDVYDARVGGGEPPPSPPPVECDGDACQSPLSAPLDTTPASFAFSGPGNVHESSKPKPKAKSCRKGMARRKRRCVKAKRRHARRTSRQTDKHHGGAAR